MAVTTAAPAFEQGEGDGEATRTNGRRPAPRPLHRRGGLPGGRAVVGGLLVALAALGVFAAWQAASGGPSGRYVVASRTLRPGDVLAAGDVALRPAELPPMSAAHAFTDPAALVGAVVLGPVAEGELVQQAAVASRGAASIPGHELSFSLPAERAVGGELVPGERIAVLATYGTGAQAVTETVVTDALLVDVSHRDGGIDGDAVVLTVAVASPDAVVALTHATRAGEVTVARATAAAGAGLPERHPPGRDG